MSYILAVRVLKPKIILVSFEGLIECDFGVILQDDNDEDFDNDEDNDGAGFCTTCTCSHIINPPTGVVEERREPRGNWLNSNPSP